MMENAKATHHHYGTRNNKIPKIDTHENDGLYESRKPSGLMKTVYSSKNGGSPSSPAVRANKLCLFSGYASPPCRPIISSSQANDNEIEWDLTSPSARRYQTLMSDKKTSTPNRTPTRGELAMKRELPRPRLALCKKNIALSSSEDNGLDLMDELAALDNLVNSEQAKQGQGFMTPPLSVRGNTDCSGNSSPAFVLIKNCEAIVQKGDVETSDAFGDDSFFSESMLLSTQALEKEAANPGVLNNSSPALQKISSPSVPSSPESLVQMNPIRKSFDIETNNDDEVGTEISISTSSRSLNITSTQISSTAHSVRREEKVMPSPIPKKKPDTFLPPNKIPSRPNAKQSSTPKRASSIVESKPLKPIPPPTANRPSNSPRFVTVPPVCIGIKRLPEEPPTPPVSVCNPPKVSNLFDDGDDDFLFALAEQVESQYVQEKPPKKESEFNDDDIFFQPEVLEFISQIERSQSVPAKPKSTAELLEEKRQAAIRRREQRMMNRR